MKDYYIILGMDWLSRYQATIDCKRKSVTFQLLRNEQLHSLGLKKVLEFQPTESAKVTR